MFAAQLKRVDGGLTVIKFCQIFQGAFWRRNCATQLTQFWWNRHSFDDGDGGGDGGDGGDDIELA